MINKKECYGSYNAKLFCIRCDRSTDCENFTKYLKEMEVNEP
jgi:plasmid rolling circle replication initiator protein Rep